MAAPVAFRESTPGRLAAYDTAHGTNLIAALEAFFAHNRNASRAAAALFVHYNTFKHRLDRVEQLLGPVLANPERSLDLALALRITRLLRR